MLLCLSRGICWCLGREIYLREHIYLPKLGVYWCVGREIFYRQHISQSKPGSMLSRGQRNCLQTADFSVQAGQYAVARAEKFSTDSRFLSPSRAYTVARAEKLPADSRFLSLSRVICCREGREIFYRQQISLPKPGSMLSRGQKVRHTCAVKSVRKRIYLTRKNTCGSLVT